MGANPNQSPGDEPESVRSAYDKQLEEQGWKKPEDSADKDPE